MDKPATREDLIKALNDLGRMSPIDRARACPDLIVAAQGILARERAAAMAEARTTHSVIEIANHLGITRQKVYDALALANEAG